MRVEGPWGPVSLGLLPEGTRKALELLVKGAGKQALVTRASQGGGLAASAQLELVLRRLSSRGLLHHVVRASREEWARLEPTSTDFALASWSLAPGQQWRLSRFAFLRGEGGWMVLESPRCRARLVLSGSEAVRVVSTFVSAQALEAPASGRRRAATLALTELMARAELLVPVDAEGRGVEEREPSLLGWEFHDLLFHSYSRRARHGVARGGTYALAPLVPSPPAVRPPISAERIPLERPELEQRIRSDAPLADVMERRRSIRRPGPRPITLRELAEVLFRCARVRAVLPGSHAGDEISSRPHPSGGARYPLEFYLAVHRCDGLPQGLYRYDPAAHLLERVGGPDGSVGELLDGTALGPERPDVLVVMAARLLRVSWKYQTIAYTTVLKDAGVLLQSFYLVATAMGLSCCAVGISDPDVFARASGTDALAEPSVAELVLGGPPA